MNEIDSGRIHAIAHNAAEQIVEAVHWADLRVPDKETYTSIVEKVAKLLEDEVVE